MKTIAELNTTITELTQVAIAAKEAKNIREKKRVETRIGYLKECKMYLETNPAEEFLTAERARLENRVNKFLETFQEPENIPKRDAKKLLKKYENEMGVTKHRAHLRTINFLLN